MTFLIKRRHSSSSEPWRQEALARRWWRLACRQQRPQASAGQPPASQLSLLLLLLEISMPELPSRWRQISLEYQEVWLKKNIANIKMHYYVFMYLLIENIYNFATELFIYIFWYLPPFHLLLIYSDVCYFSLPYPMTNLCIWCNTAWGWVSGEEDAVQICLVAAEPRQSFISIYKGEFYTSFIDDLFQGSNSRTSHF